MSILSKLLHVTFFCLQLIKVSVFSHDKYNSFGSTLFTLCDGAPLHSLCGFLYTYCKVNFKKRSPENSKTRSVQKVCKSTTCTFISHQSLSQKQLSLCAAAGIKTLHCSSGFASLHNTTHAVFSCGFLCQHVVLEAIHLLSTSQPAFFCLHLSPGKALKLSHRAAHDSTRKGKAAVPALLLKLHTRLMRS